MMELDLEICKVVAKTNRFISKGMSKEIIIHHSAENIDKTAWDSLVKQSPVASWFQTPEAYYFFNNLSFLDAFFIAIESNGRLKGVVVGFIQKDGGKIKQFFSS